VFLLCFTMDHTVNGGVFALLGATDHKPLLLVCSMSHVSKEVFGLVKDDKENLLCQ